MAHVYRMTEGDLHWKFQRSKNKIQVFGGGFANGKTTALVMKALKLAQVYPGSDGLLARATYKQLNDTLRKEFYKWCPPGWIKHMPTKDDNTLKMVNGTTINFRYVQQRGKKLEDGSTTSNLLSATYDWIGIDQIEDPMITQKDLDDLMGRLRGSTPYRPPRGEEEEGMPTSGPRWLMLTCNPTSNWFYKTMIQPYKMWQKTGIAGDQLAVWPKSQLPIMDLFEGSTYTNQRNLALDFIEGLEAKYRGQMRERFLLGKWAAFEGLVYGDFNLDRHMVPRERILEYLRGRSTAYVRFQVKESYDFGIVVPSCYLFGVVDDQGRVFILDGFYRSEFDIKEQPEEILRIQAKWATQEGFIASDPVIADPDIFRRKVISQHGVMLVDSIASVLKQGNDLRFKAADNTVLSGIAKVSSYLNGRPELEDPFGWEDPVFGPQPGAMLYVAQELDWVGTEFQNYFWKRTPTGAFVDEPMDRDDHALDALRYMLSKLPHPSEIMVPRSAREPEWMKWHELSDEEARRYH